MFILLLVFCAAVAVLLFGLGFSAELQELHQKLPPGPRPGSK